MSVKSKEFLRHCWERRLQEVNVYTGNGRLHHFIILKDPFSHGFK
jgi:DNA-nicking Smr family endonuclease